MYFIFYLCLMLNNINIKSRDTFKTQIKISSKRNLLEVQAKVCFICLNS